VSDPSAPEPARALVRPSPLRLHSLALVAGRREPGRKGAPFAASVLVHSTLVVLVVLVPLLRQDALPGRDASGFFAEPLVIAAPAPPPPPPPPGIGSLSRQPALVAAQVQAFLAPHDVSREIEPDALDLGPAGTEGGVEGGVPEGVVGSLVGDLPPAAPPASPRIVRVSSYAAPRLVHKVAPTYPDLALRARVSGIVAIEAQVDTRGGVTTVRVISGHPLLEEAAVEAVRQWRYQPLLLSGEPAAFIVTVSVSFTLSPHSP